MKSASKPPLSLVAGRDVDGSPREPADDCPITPLGSGDGIYYFLSPRGDLRQLRFNELTTAGIASIFDGNVDWLVQNFPRFSQKKPMPGKFDASEAATHLMTLCARRWDPNHPVRGAGVWMTRDGRLIIHAGNVVLVDGIRRKPGFVLEDEVYVADAPVSLPLLDSDARAGTADVEELAALLGSWSWRHPFAAELLLGELALAMLGAAAGWTTNMMVSGIMGSGKSLLAAICREVLGGGAHDVMTDATEAGMRGAMRNQSLALLFDEAEPREGSDRALRLVEFIRQLSTPGGAQIVRGTGTGRADTYSANGVAFLFSILSLPLKPQDESRFLRLELLPLTSAQTTPAALALLEHRRAHVRARSAALRGRVLSQFRRWAATLARYRDALLEAGASMRTADKLGTVLAARDLLRFERDVDSDTVAIAVEAVAHLIPETTANSGELDEGKRCLQHLMTQLVLDGSRDVAIADLLREAATSNATERHCLPGKRLQTHGLRIAKDITNAVAGLHVVAGVHALLDRLFEKTPWGPGSRGQALAYLVGAHRPEKPVRIGGSPVRTVFIPARHLPLDFDDDE